MFWLLFSLVWGTIRLFVLRNNMHKFYDPDLEENHWGFGQLVPVLLLLLPVLLMAEGFSGKISLKLRPQEVQG